MKIIINADDAGIDWDRDLGIMVGILMKKISSVSILITDQRTYPRLKKMIRNTRRYNRRVSFGLHLNLTDETLLTCKLSDLCGSYDNNDHPKVVFWREAIQNNVDIDRVRVELEAQYARFCEVLQIKPSHIDGHNHCHISNPDIFSMVHELAERHDIRNVRFPDELYLESQVTRLHEQYMKGETNNGFTKTISRPELVQLSVDEAVQMVNTMRQSPLSDIFLYKYACSRLIPKYSRKFLGTVYGHFRTVPALMEQISHIQSSGDTIVHELMVHPGAYLPFKHNTWFSNFERQKELINLFKLSSELKKNSIEIINQLEEAL